MAVANGKAGGVQKVHFEMPERLDQVGEGVHRVAVIAIQGHDQVAGGAGETALVAAAIAAHGFPNHLRSHTRSHVMCAVGGVVVHHDHFVHEFRHALQHAADSFLLIEAGDDDGDALPFIHADMMKIC